MDKSDVVHVTISMNRSTAADWIGLLNKVKEGGRLSEEEVESLIDPLIHDLEKQLGLEAME
jgi:hypothetical protein